MATIIHQKDFGFLIELDWRERAIFNTVLQYQTQNSWKPILQTELQKRVKTEYKITPRSYARARKRLEEKNVLTWKHIEGQKKHAKFFSINPLYSAEFEEYDKLKILSISDYVDYFIKESEKLETRELIKASYEFIFSTLTMLPIKLMLFKHDFSKWMLYEENYQCIEKLIKLVYERIAENKEEKVIMELFILTESIYSHSSFSQKYGSESFMKYKEKIIRLLTARAIIDKV